MKKNIEEIDLDRIDECANDPDGIDDQSMTAGFDPVHDRVDVCVNDRDGIDDNEYYLDDIDSSDCRL